MCETVGWMVVNKELECPMFYSERHPKANRHRHNTFLMVQTAIFKTDQKDLFIQTPDLE